MGTTFNFIEFRNDTAANWASYNPIPLIGEPCFEIDTGIVKIGDGTNHYLDLPVVGTKPVYTQVSTDQTTTSQSLSSITGLTAPVNAGCTYEFEAWLIAGTSGDNNGVKYGFGNVGGSLSYISAILIGAYANNQTGASFVTAENTASQVFLFSSHSSGAIYIKGTFMTITAGTFAIKHLKPTNGIATVYAGSSLKLTKIS